MGRYEDGLPPVSKPLSVQRLTVKIGTDQYEVTIPTFEFEIFKGFAKEDCETIANRIGRSMIMTNRVTESANVPGTTISKQYPDGSEEQLLIVF